MRRRLLLGSLAGVLACGSEPRPARDRGAELASDPGFSPSSFNSFACTTCHATGGDPRLLPGYPLPGASRRPSFWGGYEPDLRSAVDFCLVYFMKGDPLDPADPDARALYEYLGSLEGPADALPLTLVRSTTTAPARGDPGRGATLHARACQGCHGAATSGAGALGGAPILPQQARAEAERAFPDFDPAAVFTEKVRHGQFFGVGGNMPPYALELMSQAELGDLLAFYGL